MNGAAHGDWIGWLIGLIAVILAVVFYFKSRATARLVCQWRGRLLVGGEEADLPADVVITYKGAAVPRLSSAKVVFWNSGKLTVRGSDIVEADPLRIVLAEDAVILRAVVNSVTRSVNSFSVRIRPEKANEAICTFDFLDAGDGARIELLHTSNLKSAKVVGTIRGLPTGIGHLGKIQSVSKLRSSPVPLVWMIVIAMAVGLSTLLVGIFGPSFGPRYETIAACLHLPIIKSRTDRIAAILAGAVYVIPPTFILWSTRRRFPRALSEDE
jgi:hypothetical protein